MTNWTYTVDDPGPYCISNFVFDADIRYKGKVQFTVKDTEQRRASKFAKHLCRILNENLSNLDEMTE